MQGYIYLIENKINGKKYIGQTVYSIEERFQQHLIDCNKHLERPLYRAINKYGKENFEIHELEKCPVEILDSREQYWIQYYNTFHGEGYNATLGGEGTLYWDHEQIIKTYLETKSFTETARIIGCCADTVQKVINSNNIQPFNSHLVMKEKRGNKIQAFDFKTNVLIENFGSQIEAGQWLIDNQKTKITDLKKLSYVIGRAARGLDNRKQAYGYKWKFIE